jgi:hypothetical protein
MSDLVSRLRDADTTRRIGESYADTHERRQRDRNEAAAEIERLNRELDDVWDALAIQREDNGSFGDAFKRMTSEIERLRAALETVYGLPNFAKHYGTQLHDEIRSLKGAP